MKHCDCCSIKVNDKNKQSQFFEKFEYYIVNIFGMDNCVVPSQVLMDDDVYKLYRELEPSRLEIEQLNRLWVYLYSFVTGKDRRRTSDSFYENGLDISKLEAFSTMNKEAHLNIVRRFERAFNAGELISGLGIEFEDRWLCAINGIRQCIREMNKKNIGPRDYIDEMKDEMYLFDPWINL